MIHYLKSEWLRLKRNKLILIFIVLDLLLFSYLFYKKKALPSASRIFMMVNLFFVSCSFVLSFGEILEKGIIRYYLEYVPNRFRFINYILLKYVGLLLLVCMFSMSLMSRDIADQFLVYLIFSLLYLMVNTIIIINIGKAGVGLLLSIISLWILPDLVNYIFSKTGLFNIQLAYYLSPSTFQSIGTIYNLLISFLYIFFFYLLSVYQFNRKEF